MNETKFQVVAGSTPFLKSKEREGQVYKEATTKEKEFYESLPEDNELNKFIPKYYGSAIKDGKEYIILEDLTYGYKKPNIMDIKLGLSHHDVDLYSIYSPATLSDTEDPLNEGDTHQFNFETLKRQSNMSLHKEIYQSWLHSKYITTPKLGFCVCGSQKFNYQTSQFDKTQKEQGRTFTIPTVKDKLSEFFHNGLNSRPDIVELMIKRLSEFKLFFENNPDYRFRSTSILFIYEGDEESGNKCDIRLIDFTHTKHYPPHIKPHSSKLSQYKSIDINSLLSSSSSSGSSNSNNFNNSTSINNISNGIISSGSSNNSNNNSNINTYNGEETYFPIDGGYLFGITNLLKLLDCINNNKQ